MTWEIAIRIAFVAIGALTSAIPMFIKWNSARKAKNHAQELAQQAVTEADYAIAEAEKKKAQLEMLEQANEFITIAEITFNSFDKVLKSQNNGSAGSMKKESVLNKLQAFAFSKGYEFDSEYWSNKIDEIVSFTKSVNSKSNV